MSMTREDVVKHIEQGNFSVFTKVPEKEFVTVADHINNCFTEEYLRSTDSTKWLAFIRYLISTPQKFLKMPDFIIAIVRMNLNRQLVDETAKTRCSELILMMLDELEKYPDYSLSGNKLSYLATNLLNNTSAHAALLNLISAMPETDKSRVYGCLLDQYITHPHLLYQAYQFEDYPVLIKALEASTDDEDKIYFLRSMNEIFDNAKENAWQGSRSHEVESLCRFLTDLDDNTLAVDIDEELVEEMYKLKRISTQSEKVLDKVQDMIRDDRHAMMELNKLRGSDDSKKILEFTNKMTKFLDGFGNLGYKEGLLINAQVASRKKYDYDPVVLQDGEFRAFLETMREAPKPIRKRFISTGDHWIAGDIEVDVDGFARFALFDSLGMGANGIFRDTLEHMRVFSSFFPFSPIYFANEQRQRSDRGCSVFASDDARHLFNIEKNQGKNLFEFFESQHRPVNEIKFPGRQPIIYHPCQMPLSLMRTSQSISQLERIKNEGDARLLEMPVNRKGEKFKDSINNKVHGSVGRFFKPKPNIPSQSVNTRLEYELEKMAEYSAIYMLTHDEKAIQADLEKFTLEKFKNECEENALTHIEENIGNTSLQMAIMANQADLALQFIEGDRYDDRPNPRGRKAIDFALHARGLNNQLLDYFLMKAVQLGDLDKVKSFLLRGADINEPGVLARFGEYPIHAALRMRNVELVKLLLDDGADIKVLDNRKVSPLELAISTDNLALILPFFEAKKGLANTLVNAGAVSRFVQDKNWTAIATLLLSLPVDKQLSTHEAELIMENQEVIYKQFMQQVASVTDLVRRRKILESVSNSYDCLLGALFDKKLEYKMGVDSQKSSVEALMLLDQLDSTIKIPSPKIE